MSRRVPPPIANSKSCHVNASWVLTALACVLQVPAAPALASETSGVFRPVIEVSRSETAQDSIMHFLAAFETEGGDGMFQRAFGTQKRPPADRGLPDIAAEEKAEDVAQIIKVAAADPYFERWQKDANERLKEEAGGKKVKLHPLQEATPDVSVIVCEAGCKTLKDEVVYKAAYVPAQAPTRTFEPATSGDKNAEQAGNAGAEPGIDEGSLPCIAGCYERPERRKHSDRPKHSERETTSRTHRASMTPAAATPTAEPPRSHQADAAPSSRPAKPEAARRRISHVINIRALKKHTKVTAKIRPAHRLQTGHNGAIIEQRHVSRPPAVKNKTAQRALKVFKARQASAAKGTKLSAWSTTVRAAAAPLQDGAPHSSDWNAIVFAEPVTAQH